MEKLWCRLSSGSGSSTHLSLLSISLRVRRAFIKPCSPHLPLDSCGSSGMWRNRCRMPLLCARGGHRGSAGPGPHRR